MKKLAAVMIYALLLAAFLLFPSVTQAKMEIVILEATGVFESIDTTLTPNEITLRIGEEDAAGPLHSRCQFFDQRGRQLDQETFVKNYLKRVITVGIIEDTGEVISCRPGS
ncbi:MAG: hypothetical protein LBJ36_08735 [Synergistaceae bacterium]|jgi:hypothetical protein|nr:hypothetical protein [Synergistaceae bacterium]